MIQTLRTLTLPAALPVAAFALLLSPLSIQSVPAQNFLLDDLSPSPDSAIVDGESDEDDSQPKKIEPDVRFRMTQGDRGTEDLARAIADFARIRELDRASTLLEQAAGQDLKEDQLSAMARKIEPAMILRIAASNEVSQAAKEMLSKIVVAGRKVATSDATLNQAIEQTLSGSIDNRLQGQRTLLRGAEASIIAIVERIVADPAASNNPNLIAVLQRLGDGGEAALRQLALYGQNSQRTGAIRSLARNYPKTINAELATAVHASNSSQEERQIASDALSRSIGRVPTLTQAIRFLANDLRVKQHAARSIANTGHQVQVWTVDETRSTVQPLKTHAMAEAYKQAADAAARLQRIDGLPADLASLVLTTSLANELIADPYWGTAEQTSAFKQRFASYDSVLNLATAIDSAVSSGDTATAVGLLRLIDSDTAAHQVQSLLYGASVTPAPLVKAVSADQPIVRYEAVSAILRLEPKRPYAGQNRVKSTLAEMSRLTAKPQVVIVETMNSIVSDWQAVLIPLGYETVVIETVSDLERVVAAGGDLRMIVSKTDLWDRSPIEMIDCLRRTRYGSKLPILFYGDGELYLNNDRWTGLTRQIDLPQRRPTIKTILDKIIEKRWIDDLGKPLTGLPDTVVILENDQAKRDEWIAKLQTVGFSAQFASNKDGLISLLDDFPNTDTVMANTNGAILSPQELIKVVRETPSGKKMDITFYGDQVLPNEILSDQMIHLILERQIVPEGLLDVRSQINQQRRLPGLTEAERSYFRDLATEALAAPIK